MPDLNNLENSRDKLPLGSESLAIDELIKGREIPRFITIEGSIGVGKTTLTKRLAESFNYETMSVSYTHLTLPTPPYV